MPGFDAFPHGQAGDAQGHDRIQADGSIRADADPGAAAWPLLLSVLSARPWRTAVMPDRDRLAGDVADLALQALVQRP